MTGKLLWQPSQDTIENHPMSAFARQAERETGRSFGDYWALHGWSVEDRAAFWDLVWRFSKIRGDKGEPALASGATMRDDRFFPQARLNFAENLLARTGPEDAIVFRGEDKVERRLEARLRKYHGKRLEHR